MGNLKNKQQNLFILNIIIVLHQVIMLWIMKLIVIFSSPIVTVLYFVEIWYYTAEATIMY